jgi:hypothetical protein
VAVNDEHAASVSEAMDGMLLNLDVAISAVEFPEQVVVVSRDINDPRALARFSKNLLDDVIVLLGPVNSAAKLPGVNEIADDVKCGNFVVPQEFEERRCIAAARPEVDIRNPRGPKIANSVGLAKFAD